MKKALDRPLQDCSRAHGLYPSGTLMRTLWRRNPTEPDYVVTSAWGSRARPSPKVPDLPRHSGSAPSSYPANDTNQGQGTRIRAPNYRGSGAPRCYSLGPALLATFPTRSCMGRQSFPMASRRSGAPEPTRQPLEPTSFTAKKTLEGPHRGGWSKPT